VDLDTHGYTTWSQELSDSDALTITSGTPAPPFASEQAGLTISAFSSDDGATYEAVTSRDALTAGCASDGGGVNDGSQCDYLRLSPKSPIQNINQYLEIQYLGVVVSPT